MDGSTPLEFLSHLYPAHTLHCFPATFFFYELAVVKSVNTDNRAVTVHSVPLLTVSPKSPAVFTIPDPALPGSGKCD